MSAQHAAEIAKLNDEIARLKGVMRVIADILDAAGKVIHCIDGENDDEEYALRSLQERMERASLCARKMANEDRAAPVFAVRRCRVCGCTEDDCSQCIEKTGTPCHWVEGDLCSACREGNENDHPL
jgi:hypothetical protein